MTLTTNLAHLVFERTQVALNSLGKDCIVNNGTIGE